MSKIPRGLFLVLALMLLAQSRPPGKTGVALYPIQASAATDKSVAKALTKGGPMVLVPAGEFMMGMSTEEALSECRKYSQDCKSEWFSDEAPVHRVKLDAFYLDKDEVTQGEYDECVRAGRCKDNEKYDGLTGTRQPVVGVDWNDAKSYCAWAGKRLPSEAEWEKGARGTDGRVYPWGNQAPSCQYAVMDDGGFGCGLKKTWEVGSKPAGASPYGAMDLAGSVWEWVADWSGESYYQQSPSQNPTGPSSGTFRVVRGGSWIHFAWYVRSSGRFGDGPTDRNPYLGFRCSRDGS